MGQLLSLCNTNITSVFIERQFREYGPCNPRDSSNHCVIWYSKRVLQYILLAWPNGSPNIIFQDKVLQKQTLRGRSHGVLSFSAALFQQIAPHSFINLLHFPCETGSRTSWSRVRGRQFRRKTMTSCQREISKRNPGHFLPFCKKLDELFPWR